MPARLEQRPDDLRGGEVGVRDQDGRPVHSEREREGRHLVEERAAVAVAEDRPLVDAAGQRQREKARARLHRERDGLAGVAEDVFGLCVAVRLLVQFLDGRHLPSRLGYLDAVGQQDGTPAGRKKGRPQSAEGRPRPEAREFFKVNPCAVEHVQQRAVARAAQPQRPDIARDARQIRADAGRRKPGREPEESPAPSERGPELAREIPRDGSEAHLFLIFPFSGLTG